MALRHARLQKQGDRRPLVVVSDPLRTPDFTRRHIWNALQTVGRCHRLDGGG